MKFAFIFSQAHLSFRVPELEGICSLFRIPVDLSALSTEAHVHILQLPSVECVRQILSRSMLIKIAVELFSSAQSQEELFEDINRKRDLIEPFNSTQQSFAIRVWNIGRKKDRKYSEEIIHKLDNVLRLERCPVDLQNPDNVFIFIEEFRQAGGNLPAQFTCFGRLVGHGQSRLKSDYNLVDRCYIGNTTMDPEFSFIQANLVRAGTGSLVLDPFCGTAGILIAAAHFGAVVVGTEINYQIARAKGKSSRVGRKYLSSEESVAGNFEQYGISDRFCSLLIADASRHAIWRIERPNNANIFDAIVTDPPYGIREKGRKVGNKPKKSHWGSSSAEHEFHYPEKTKYAMSSVFLDLLDLAVLILVVGGRIAFWFPVFREEYSEEVIPKHTALRLVANCEQPLSSKYSRRLLVYEKKRSAEEGEKAFIEKDCYKTISFRERIFVNSV